MELPKRESETVEFKESLSDIESIVQTTVSFANSKGGTLFIGITDQGQQKSISIGKNTIENLVKSISENTDPKLFPSIQAIYSGESSAILSVSVEEGMDKPYLAKGAAYKRVGTTNLKISRSEIDALVVKRNWDRVSFDKQYCEVSLDEIDEDTVSSFAANAQEQRDLKVTSSKKELVLQNLDMLDGKMRNAALVCFGKNPQKHFTQFAFQCGVIKGDDFLDMRLIEGNFFQMIDATYKYFLSNIKASFKIVGTRRELAYEYPIEAVREAITNALMHRDFFIPSGCYLAIKDDYVEIKNPGLLPEGLTIADLKKPDHPSKQRNQLIAKAAYLAGYAERWGTGTTKIFNLARKMGLKEPEYFERGGFTILRIYKTKPSFNPRQTKALTLANEKDITTNEYRKLFRINERTARTDIEELVSSGYLFKKRLGRNIFYSISS